MKLVYGRKLDYEPKHNNDKRTKENDFMTAVEFSAEYPYGKAVAMFDLKSGVLMVISSFHSYSFFFFLTNRYLLYSMLTNWSCLLYINSCKKSGLHCREYCRHLSCVKEGHNGLLLWLLATWMYRKEFETISSGVHKVWPKFVWIVFSIVNNLSLKLTCEDLLTSN